MDDLSPSTGIPAAVSDVANLGMVAGQPGVGISWQVTGTVSASSYEIFKDGISIVNGTWTTDGGYVSYDLNIIVPGSYNYTIRVSNTWANVTDTVIVTVSPSPSPVIISPGNGTYTMGNQISWTATDAGTNTTTYTLYRNGTSVASGSWTSGVAITLNLVGIAPGSYNFTIIVNDGLGGIAQDTVIVTMQAAAGPGPLAMEGVIWGVVIAFGCVGVLIVIKAVKVIPGSSKSRGREFTPAVHRNNK